MTTIQDKVYEAVNKLPNARNYAIHTMGNLLFIYPASYEDNDVMYAYPLAVVEDGIVRRDDSNILGGEGYNFSTGG